jgi:general secretion pathway protein K
MIRPPNPRNRDQTGAALLLVLWTLALLSLLAATAVQVTTASAKDVAASLERAQLTAAANGAIELALANLIDHDASSGWGPGGPEQSVVIGGSTVVVSIGDEAGKLDANRALLQMLEDLFRAGGASPSDATAWISRINRYRERSAGHSSGDRSTISDAHAARSGRQVLRSVDEVQAVGGIPDKTFDCLRSSLTVYSGFEVPDLKFATSVLKKAVAIESRSAEVDQPPLSAPVSPASYAGRVLSIVANAADGSKAFVAKRSTILWLTGSLDAPVLVSALTTDERDPADRDRQGCPTNTTQKADALDAQGFARLPADFRKLADTYEHQAERDALRGMDDD